MSIVKKTFSQVKTKSYKWFAGVLMSLGMVSNAFADLPAMQAPSRGEGSSIMETIKNYAYDGVVLAGLIIAAYAFIRVASALIDAYGEVAAGKKKWGELGGLALIGAVLLVVMIWLIVESAKIL